MGFYSVIGITNTHTDTCDLDYKGYDFTKIKYMIESICAEMHSTVYTGMTKSPKQR